MKIRGIERGDKSLRHFTFDDDVYKPINGVYCYSVTYDKNKLEGEYGEEETGYVPCDKVMPLGGRKPKPIPGVTEQKETPVQKVQTVQTPVPEPEPKKRGRPAKATKLEQVSGTIPVAAGACAYEYYVAELKVQDVQSLQNELNGLGSEGWELCCYDVDRSIFSATHIRAIFKRKRG